MSDPGDEMWGHEDYPLGFGNDDPRVIVCAGPPLCLLQGDEAVAQQQAGCEFCKLITIHPDGSETVTERKIQ